MRDIFTYVNDNGDSLALSAANGFRITSITGTSGISVNANQAQGIGQIGTTVQSRVVQSVQAQNETVSIVLGEPEITVIGEMKLAWQR